MTAKRDLVSIEDLSNEEIFALFHQAEEYREDLQAHAHVCRGTILASLFFEPSTRTRLSFESAMQRLGGSVITVPEGQSSSQAKGESLADTVRVVGGSYSDIIVMRHPDDGAARVAGRYAAVPVINGGDGAHEHPTQTLCDLYTLWKEKGHIDGLDVVLCGDLRYSRTIHSFAAALARFGANIITIPYPGLQMPEDVLDHLRQRYGFEAKSADVDDLPGIADHSDSAAYLTSSKPHQLALFTSLDEVRVQQIDAIYMTRAQRERHDGESAANYQRLSGDSLRSEATKNARVMHPLPRTDEIAYELDDDPRAVYFRQAELGVPIRMALMAFLLGKIQLDAAPPVASKEAKGIPSAEGARCINPACITNQEGRRYLIPEFESWHGEPHIRCVFCSRLTQIRLVGNRSTQLLHRYNAAEARRIKPENRIFFTSDEQAGQAGYASPGEVRHGDPT